MLNLMPVQSETGTNFHKVARKVLCRHYGTCLDYAIEKDWEGFSCRSCESYEILELDEHEWREDSSRCLALLYFVSFSKLKLSVHASDANFRTRSRTKACHS